MALNEGDLPEFRIRYRLSTGNPGVQDDKTVNATDEEDARFVFERVEPGLIFVGASKVVK